MNQFTIGLSGHIDHGKTSIVKALTGKNTDSLKDEIKRGMTIDIGFAHLNNQISIIDVPGHEKFIKNMVAGVSSIDSVILVVAADDGIMPQTREHFQILKLLGINTGIIAISKIDLVDSDWLNLVKLEIEEFIKGTFLHKAKLIELSTISMKGVDLLKDEIINISKNSYDKFDRGLFRMFIDRVFTKKGFGTVVTGTVSSGKISKISKVQILPNMKTINIRGIHSHDQIVDKLNIGDRGAINLQSIDKVNVRRGHHLGEIDYFNLVLNASVKINTSGKISHNQRVRINLGTQEVMARILFTKDFSNVNMPAFLKFENIIVASYKDKFIIRTYSPVTTIGGGEITDINLSGKWNQNKVYINKLSNSKFDFEIIENIIESKLYLVITKLDLCKHLSLSDKVLDTFLKKVKDLIYIGENNPWILTTNQYTKIVNKLIEILEDSHKKNPFIKGLLLDQINHSIHMPEGVLKYILLELCKSKKIKVDDDLYSTYAFLINLPVEDISITNKLMDILNEELYKTSGFKELASLVNQNDSKVKELIKIANNNNNVIIINGNIIFTKKNYDILLDKIDDHFKNNNTLNINEFKNMTQTSRKYAVPLLEYLDKQNITYRYGNERKYNKK